MFVDAKEIWKSLRINPRYEISNYGNIRIKKGKAWIDQRMKANVIVENKEMKRKKQKPYLYTILFFKNKDPKKNFKLIGHQYKIDRLVAMTFCKRPEGWRKMAVKHKNGNQLDNFYENLEFVEKK